MNTHHDTEMGGRSAAFTDTNHAAVQGLHSSDEGVRRASWTALVEAYWKPVYNYLRVRWNARDADAKDLTQGFLMRAIEKDFFERFDPSKAKFRTFLRVCLDRYVANEAKAAVRLKRGGGHAALSLDPDDMERGDVVPADRGLELYFEAEWVRSVLTVSVDRLRRDCEELGKQLQFELFVRYDLASADSDRPTYTALASEFGVKVTDVTNHLAWARRRFRMHALDRLRAITTTDDEFRAEARMLFGVEAT